MLRPLSKREAYQVGRKLFCTKLAAAKHEAWRLILGKYGWNEISFKPRRLSDIKSVLGYVCDCDVSTSGFIIENCPLHDRQTGYFIRLHKRLVKMILEQWSGLTPVAADAEHEQATGEQETPRR